MSEHTHSITINATSLEELKTQVIALANTFHSGQTAGLVPDSARVGASEVQPTNVTEAGQTTAEEGPKKRGRKPNSEKEEKNEKVETKVEQKAAEEVDPFAEEPPTLPEAPIKYTIDDAKKAASELIKTFPTPQEGTRAAGQILQKDFQVDRIAALKESQLGLFIESCKDAMKK